ncbi:MAG: NAD(P)H-hydrate dehydratase [Bacteroidetes bacterium]|nr:NAD(P)H-hydrate dehydratase [Bacteroidota bacterium]
MKSVFFNNEVLGVEKNIINKLSIPSIVLMENAGRNSADFILSKINRISKIVILAGKGNNAGDGFVIARHLANSGRKSAVVLLYPHAELKGDALINFKILSSYKDFVSTAYIKNWSEIREIVSEKNTVIIDAVFGIGFKGELESRLQNIFAEINSLKSKTVFAVDTPSGLYDYNQHQVCLKADYTISMAVKKFHSMFLKGREASGIIHTVDIGVSEKNFDNLNARNIFEVQEQDVRKIIPLRNINSHKYSTGKVFVLAGSKGLTGAAYLCSQSALISGCGAVMLGIPDSLNTILARKLTEVMTLPLNETAEHTLALSSCKKIQEKIKWCDALLIGPGIAKNDETTGLISNVISENDIPIVLDADGLSAFKNLKLNRRKNKIILTPHLGEFANLLDVSIDELKNNLYNYSVDYAKKKNVILVLKGSPSITTDGKQFYINSTGNPALSTAGSGDVLAGIIASLYSRTKNAIDSAIAGVYVHGKSADLLCGKSKNNFTYKASDIVKIIPHAVSSILNTTA